MKLNLALSVGQFAQQIQEICEMSSQVLALF